MTIKDLEKCPKCKAEWKYVAEDKKTYSRVIGVEIRGVYDGISEWLCPFCNTSWDRWTEEEIKSRSRK